MDQENSGTDQKYEIQASKVDQSIRASVRKSLKVLVFNLDVVKPCNYPHLVTNVDRVVCQDSNYEGEQEPRISWHDDVHQEKMDDDLELLHEGEHHAQTLTQWYVQNEVGDKVRSDQPCCNPSHRFECDIYSLVSNLRSCRISCFDIFFDWLAPFTAENFAVFKADHKNVWLVRLWDILRVVKFKL